MTTETTETRLTAKCPSCRRSMVLPWTNSVASFVKTCSCGDRWNVSVHMAKMSSAAVYHVVSFEFSPPTPEENLAASKKDMP